MPPISKCLDDLGGIMDGIHLYFPIVLIPQKAWASPPPPVPSANFMTAISPVRKTTQHFKGENCYLWGMVHHEIYRNK